MLVLPFASRHWRGEEDAHVLVQVLLHVLHCGLVRLGHPQHPLLAVLFLLLLFRSSSSGPLLGAALLLLCFGSLCSGSGSLCLCQGSRGGSGSGSRLGLGCLGLGGSQLQLGTGAATRCELRRGGSRLCLGSRFSRRHCSRLCSRLRGRLLGSSGGGGGGAGAGPDGGGAEEGIGVGDHDLDQVALLAHVEDVLCRKVLGPEEDWSKDDAAVAAVHARLHLVGRRAHDR
mmetsp:Transcript_7928/g.33362  ORF Transcript_7928/g.33362 Transcript_7928/m.33362 type:complete len:229 (-) Transcript_7928:542-1228(-)